jgi:hypothetical protein
MKKLWALKVGGVQIEEKRKSCFVSMKVFFFNFHWFSSFSIPKQTFGQWELNLWTFSTINASKVLIMFILQLLSPKFQLYIFSYILIGFNHISIRFPLCLSTMYNYAHDVYHFYSLFSSNFSRFQNVFSSSNFLILE